MPTLLQINSTANWGSTGKIAEQIGELAMQQGWESYIAYGRNVNTSRSKLIKIGSKLSVYWHLIESRLFDNHGLASRWATRKLIKQIKQIKPDIIHLHNIHGYYLNYKILFNYLNKTNIPIVWTLHDCWTFTGHCAHFISVDCDKWKTGCKKCQYGSVYPSALTDFSERNFQLKKRLFSKKKNTNIVACSNWLHDFVSVSHLCCSRSMVIHNGIDINVFSPREREEANITRIIAISNKGLSDICKLRELLDNNSYEITVIGLKQEEINRLPAGIIGLPRTNSADELANLYSQADVFINPTYADTFPTTNLEAMACGTPVITYRTGGSPESITPETGFVVEQGDINGLVKAIEQIRSNGKQYYSAACRKHAEENFDKDKCFAKYIELYNEILSKR